MRRGIGEVDVAVRAVQVGREAPARSRRRAVAEDVDRDRYMSPADAVDYGLIDRIIEPGALSDAKGSDREKGQGTGGEVKAMPTEAREDGPEAG